MARKEKLTIRQLGQRVAGARGKNVFVGTPTQVADYMEDWFSKEACDGFNVKITDDELKGRYSNLLRITHTREEFILDFINLVPPQGIVTARVVASPGHLKRILRALSANLERYEKTYGVVQESPDTAEDDSVH